MQHKDIERLINLRGKEYPDVMQSLKMMSPTKADVLVDQEFSYGAGYFTGSDDFFGYPDLCSVLTFWHENRLFYILRFAGHWEANIGGMMEEVEGDLVELFDETCRLFEINPINALAA